MTRKVGKKPNQARSKAKVEGILAAAEHLLNHQQLETIGPYEVAKQAEVPPASVYYFFPTIGDLWATLTATVSRRVTRHLAEAGFSNAEGELLIWQDAFRHQSHSIVKFFNLNHAASELILGPNTTREVYKTFDTGDITSAKFARKLLMRYYQLPDIPNLELKLNTAITASEAILRKSYRQHGTITPEMEQESIRMLIAYMRTILPEELNFKLTH